MREPLTPTSELDDVPGTRFPQGESHVTGHPGLAVAGCNGPGATGSTGGPDAIATIEGGDAVVDALADSSSSGTGLAASDATFLCLRDGGSYPNLLSTADVRCQTSEFCFISGGGSVQEGCWPLGPGLPDAGPAVFLSDAGCKDGSATCGCVVVACGGSPSCKDDDGGGVTVSCGTCYGAPPAQLDA
jgi:hypothetical protein